MFLTKANLIDSVSRSYSTRLVEALLEIIKQTLESGETLILDKGCLRVWHPQKLKA